MTSSCNFRSFCILLLLGLVSSFQNNKIPPTTTATTGARSTVALPYVNAEVEDVSGSSSFRQRMLNRMRKGEKKSTPKTHESLTMVKNLDEFKTEVVEEAEGLVAVWFMAPWCRACKAVAPAVLALAKRHPDVKFVQVPVLEDNKVLHQGLGVPSVPFIHLYHPEGGLVEEQKLSRKTAQPFHKKLEDYDQESCSLTRGETWSSDCPYEVNTSLETKNN